MSYPPWARLAVVGNRVTSHFTDGVTSGNGRNRVAMRCAGFAGKAALVLAGLLARGRHEFAIAG